MIDRNDIMDFFRIDSEDFDNLNSLSIEDKNELILTLASYSDELYNIIESALDY